MVDEKAQESRLTAKQDAFVREYLIDLNATQAAVRAGYSAATAYSIGSENLSKPEIQSAIQSALSARAKRTEITADYVLTKIQQTVERCSAEDPEEHNPAAVLKGCELLGKHLKLFTEKHEIAGPNGGAIPLSVTPDAAVDARLSELAAKLLPGGSVENAGPE
jgi:phage terminase small subunit